MLQSSRCADKETEAEKKRGGLILSRVLWPATGGAEFKVMVSDSQASSALMGRY